MSHPQRARPSVLRHRRCNQKPTDPRDAQRMAYRAEPTIGVVKQAGVRFATNLRGVDEDFYVVVGVMEEFFETVFNEAFKGDMVADENVGIEGTRGEH